MTSLQKMWSGIKIFRIPLIILIGIVLALLIEYVFLLPGWAAILLLAVTLLGSYNLLRETFTALVQRQFALDYLALLAIITALVSQAYLVAAVIALMISSGRTLETYGLLRAKKSLTALTDRIPRNVQLWQEGQVYATAKIEEVQVGQKILVRKGEVIPLDGILISEAAITDESSLTGEPYIIDKKQGDPVRSGTVNGGNAIVIEVTKKDQDSTYRKIIEMVRTAAEEKSPLIRLADRYSIMFTVISLLIACLGFFVSQGISGVLAVLVLATPCPLLLATPIALLGGVNAAAKRKIIVKRLASIEVLSRVNTIIFDKTGTLTLGRPVVKNIILEDPAYQPEEVLAIAAAIEHNSLHPIAKAIVAKAVEERVKRPVARDVREQIGHGITGSVAGKTYALTKVQDQENMTVALQTGDTVIAYFELEDELKQDSKKIIRDLRRLGLKIHIYTGDKKDRAEKVVRELGGDITVKTDCSPEEKMNGIRELKQQGFITAMVGDGINDAPALALADVGLVFSNEEQTASSEAADIVFLGGDLSMVLKSMTIARNTVRIALQSILVGIGLSIVGMLFAAFGYIPPLIGAFMQEAIDVLVILNALRTTR